MDTTTSSVAPWLFAPGVSATPTAKEVAAAYRSALLAFCRSLKRARRHTGRHSFATALISAGVSPAYVQRQLGHSDVFLTVRVYGSRFPARVPGAVDGVAAAFTGSLAGHRMDTSARLETA